MIGIPDASQCSPPGLAARRRRFLTLTPPWQVSPVGLGRGVEVVRGGSVDGGEAETGRIGEGGERWVFLSRHWLRWMDSFSRGLRNKRFHFFCHSTIISCHRVMFSWSQLSFPRTAQRVIPAVINAQFSIAINVENYSFQIDREEKEGIKDVENMWEQNLGMF